MPTLTENTYSFNHFLEQRKQLNDLNNPFLELIFRAYSGDSWEYLHGELEAFANKVSGKWRKLVDEISRVENHPNLDTLMRIIIALTGS